MVSHHDDAQPSLTIDEPAAMDAKYLKLSKLLAHTEKRQRDKAVRIIRQSLTLTQHQMSRLDMLKLWKGLFYCMWMSDKPLIQQELAVALAKMALEFDNEQNILGYFQAFWMTMAREWHGIDYLRLDKFYFLCRQMITCALEWLRDSEWSCNMIERWNDLLCSSHNFGPLSDCVESKRVPLALCYHFCEYYAGLIHQVATEKPSGKPLSLQSTELLIEPLVGLGCRTENKLILKKLKDNFADFLVSQIENGDKDNDDDNNDDDNDTIVNNNSKSAGLDARIVGRLMWERVSGDESIAPANRKLFYETVQRISGGDLSRVLSAEPLATANKSATATAASTTSTTTSNTSTTTSTTTTVDIINSNNTATAVKKKQSSLESSGGEKKTKNQTNSQSAVLNDENDHQQGTVNSNTIPATPVASKSIGDSVMVNIVNESAEKSVSWSEKSRVKLFYKRLPVARSPSPVVISKKPEKGLLKKPFSKPLIMSESEWSSVRRLCKRPRLEFLELQQSSTAKSAAVKSQSKQSQKRPQKQPPTQASSTASRANQRPTAADFM